MQYIPEKYDSKIPKRVVDFYSAISMTDKERMAEANRKSKEREGSLNRKYKEREGDLDRKSRERIAAQRQAQKKSSGYTKAQMIDDTRMFYKDMLKGLPDKDIDPEEYEKQHSKVMSEMRGDLSRVSKGFKPFWMSGDSKPEPEGEIVRRGKYKGMDVAEYENGVIVPIDHRQDKRR
jgi:hypothetical protein